MSRRRYISTEISTDTKIVELAEHGTLPLLLFTWTIPHLDDWGRMAADPRQFKLLVCPALDITVHEVSEAIRQIAAVGLWTHYEVNGKWYIAIEKNSWFKHQSYINKAKRDSVDHSHIPQQPSSQASTNTAEHRFDQSEATPNTVKYRDSPQNAVTPTPTPSFSPSLSPTLDYTAATDNAHEGKNHSELGNSEQHEKRANQPPSLPSLNAPLANAKRQDNRTGDVLSYAEEKWGRTLSPRDAEVMLQARDDLDRQGSLESDELIQEAIRRSADNNVRTASYFDSITRRWLDRGLLSLQKIRDADAQFRQAKGGKVSEIHSGRLAKNARNEPREPTKPKYPIRNYAADDEGLPDLSG